MSNSHRNKWLSRRTSVARFCWHSHFKVYCFSSFTSASPVSWTGYLPNAPNIPTSSSLPILLSLSAGAEKHSVPSVIPSPLSKQVRMTFCPTKFFSLFNLFTSELVDLFSLKQGLSLSSTGCPGTNNTDQAGLRPSAAIKGMDYHDWHLYGPKMFW